MSFIIYSLPRSRTYWLSKFLTYGDWHCGHDEIRYARTLEDIHSWFSMPCTGTVETAGASFWRLAHHINPNVKTVVIHRPHDEVMKSLRNAGIDVNEEMMRSILNRSTRKLHQIEARVPNVLSVQFDELNSESVCKTIFEHCLPYQHDHDWWEYMASINIQVDMRQIVKYYHAHVKQITKMSKIAYQTMLQSIQRPPSEMDEVVIKEEPFQTWLDEKMMVGTHFAVIGEAPDMINDMNIEKMKMLDAAGQLQMVVARSNGRAFGYLISMITDSMMHSGHMAAYHSAFYASSEFKGLGTKLMKEANSLLESKGITEIVGRTGNRDSADRLSTIFKRMGAEEYGQLYLLKK